MDKEIVLDAKAVAVLDEHSLVTVSRQHVPLDQAVRGANRLDPGVEVSPEGAAQDADVATEEDAQPVALRIGRAIPRAVSHQDSVGACQREATEVVPRCGDPEQTRTTSVE